MERLTREVERVTKLEMNNGHVHKSARSKKYNSKKRERGRKLVADEMYEVKFPGIFLLLIKVCGERKLNKC